MHREYEVLVTVKLPVIAEHETDAQRIASETIRTKIASLRQAFVVKTETK